MRVLVLGVIAVVVAACGTDEGGRDQRIKENIQEAREAYETCMTIHNNADPESCASYKAEYDNDLAVWRRLHPNGPKDQPSGSQ